MKTGIGSHTRAHRGATDSWITPRHLIERLGPFDLDPCEAPVQPWPCAHQAFTDGGLTRPWHGRVWLNPPYGPQTGRWLERLAEHGDGIALTFARTETRMFHRYVFGRAAALMFLEGRLYFYRPDGSRAAGNAGGPSVLIAYGERNVACLNAAGRGVVVREV